MKKIGDTKKVHKMAKVFGCLGLALVLISGILIVASSDVSGEDNVADKLHCRPELPDGKPHTDKLVRYKAEVTLSETKILIVTSGHGPLTGISPIEEKDYWLNRLGTMGYSNVDWYDGIPTFDLLNQYDLVIYDAGGYWYPLSNEVEPLWDYHFTGKPLIIVAPDINYDWENIKSSSKPTFCEDVTHISGVLGIMPEVGFEVIANTGHEIIVSVPTGLEIPVASQSSWPDCFDPAPGCDGVLTQGYIASTEFGVGSCSDLPSFAPYDPLGSLFSVVAYPGSDSEGRAVLFGFPPTAIEQSNILDNLAEGTIDWALAQEKPADIELTLYIEDATTPKGAPAIVNKAPGDKIDVVAVVVNKEVSSQTVVVELSVPTELGDPEKVIIRSDFSPHTRIQEVEPGVLSVELMNLEPGEIQVVWRFEISDSASPQSTIVQADARVGGESCATGAGGFCIVDRADAIIVTNRYLLYGNYDDDEVGSLLRYLFQISEWGNTISKKNCIVYYVDHYDAELEDWDQDVDYSSENKANEVANDIDGLIEDWAEKLVKSGKYPYMMIVGGDEVIPFYRTLLPPGISHEKDYGYSTPLFEALKHNYYLTDSVYADVKKDDWGTGNVELATGRITGHSAKNMQNFIENGLTGPQGSKNMIVLADHRNEGKNIAKDGKTAGFNILNDDESPNTIETENWKDTDVMTAMKKGFKLLWHASHGDYNSLDCDSNSNTNLDTNEVLDTTKVGNIKDKKPFISTAGCHSGLLGNKDTTNSASDNLVWAFIDQGISGYLGSSARVSCLYGGNLGVDFYSHVFKKESVGSAFKETLVNFDPTTNRAKRTVREFILYGVPWMPVKLPGVPIQSSTQTLSRPSYNISAGAALDAYTTTVDVAITDCTFESKESFEVPVLNGDFDDMRYTSNTYEPVVPYIKKQMIFPLECEVTDVDVSLSAGESLGMHNIPSALNDPTASTLYTDITTASGIYPPWIKYYETNTLEGNTILNIYVSPLRYDISTHEVLLFKQVEISITYQTPVTATITDFSPTKTEYTSGEAIITSITIENVGSDALTGLYVNLSLVDPYGQVKTSGVTPTFDVAAGESRTISVELGQSLPHGSYTAEMNLINSTGDVLGSSSEQIYISTGEITDFILPSEVKSGEDITFNITFENKNTMDVEANGVVYIYDPNDIEIAQLPSLPVTVAPDAAEQISISWSTVGKEIGAYKAVAYVFANEESFSSEYHVFEIKSVAADDIAAIRDRLWYVDTNGDRLADIFFNYGLPEDTFIVSDINQDGFDDIAAIRGRLWYVDTSGGICANLGPGCDYIADQFFNYGLPGDTFIVADINRDGTGDIAAIRGRTWYVDTNGDHIADLFFNYGLPNDTFIVGDVNQDGKDDIAAIRGRTWYVDTNGDHIADLFFNYGLPGDTFIVGDVNQDGKDDIVAIRGRTWYVDTNGDHIADLFFNYGLDGDIFLVGDIH